MATERELNKRIKSIKNISQVTSALAAVSASKASRAQKQVEATRDYAGKAFEILNNLAAQPDAAHPLLTVRTTVNKVGLILISGDRGLCGAYNTNIINRVEAFMRTLTAPVEVVTVGRKGRDLMIRRGYNVVATFENPDTPSILDITPIAKIVTEDYLAGKVDQVFIAYTDFVNLINRRPTVKQLLPLKPLDFEGMAMAEYVQHVDFKSASLRTYTYEPRPDVLLDVVVPRFTQLQIYQSILEALASEHSARMVAMNNATDNAAELIDVLTLERNKARQTSITSEILDIVGGAESLRK
ncbi:MAG: ATP synthase F1 subunit gamma [Chloroflexota bacterium]|nr:ATP synthase F1 subunit gamma [Anaerolineales bacterium]MCB8968529.1 ATP synthase F1 subunit gamma [Ardenticatenaceae bacterium]